MISCLLSAQQGISENVSTLKAKRFAPMWSKYFPFRVYFFSEGRQNNFRTIAALTLSC